MLAHEIQTRQVQNITVMLESTRDDILKDFRCNACGKTVFKYYGGIHLLVPGELTVDWLDIGRPKPIQCKNKRRVMVYDERGQRREIEVKCKIVYFVVG